MRQLKKQICFILSVFQLIKIVATAQITSVLKLTETIQNCHEGGAKN